MKPDQECYQRLIEPIQDRMIAIVTRIMQDHHDAQDVFQEVLAVIWKTLIAMKIPMLISYAFA